MPLWEIFETRGELAKNLAVKVAKDLQDRIKHNAYACIAVSGGSSPVSFFKVLSLCPIDWRYVTIMLVDERDIDPQNPRSNEALVRKHLLRNKASVAHFVPLYSPHDIAEIEHSIRKNLPLDVVVLGMGLDGHTASLFPTADKLKEGLEFHGHRSILPIHADGVPEPRITMTLRALRTSHYAYVLIHGEEKRELLETALRADDRRLPIIPVLDSLQQYKIYYAP